MQQLPVWYIKKLKEAQEGKRCDAPCLGYMSERTYGYWDAEDNYKVLQCVKCGKTVDGD